MARYIAKRALLVFFTLMVILTLTFILIKLIPDHPPIDPTMDPEMYEKIMETYGYNRPVIIQYFYWLRNIITRWDWGISRKYIGQGAFQRLALFLPATMKINIIAFIISIPLGLLLGIVAALKKNTVFDYTISTVVMIFISVPSFVVMSVLVLIFAGQLKVVPVVWSQMGFKNSEILRYILPVASLSFGPIASLTRYTRAELTEVLTSEYLLLARTKGLNKKQTILRHALRNAFVPLIGIVIGNFVGILGGALVIENIYSIPGSGRLLLESIMALDYDVTLAILGFYTIIGLAATLLIDISYGLIDPRIRMGAKK